MNQNVEPITFSEYAQDFIDYDGSYFDILEGTTGGGKTVAAECKFIKRICMSNARNHLLCCQNLQKTEQNVISGKTGIVAMFTDEYGNELVSYYPNGYKEVKAPHLRVKYHDFDQIIYFISYSDSKKADVVRSGRYGCTFIDEINKVKGTNMEEVADFVVEALQRSDDYIVATLNPDDPDLPLYSELINKARPIEKYKHKGPKEIRNLLTSEEDPEYKWWFFDFYDNPSMTEERIERIKKGCKGNKRQYDSLVRGLRGKTESLAFPYFDDEQQVLTTNDILHRLNDKELKERQANIKWKHLYCGVDTAFSPNTGDLIVFEFVGITTHGDVYVLDEFSFNNKDATCEEEMMDGIDVAKALVGYKENGKEIAGFLSKNFKKWGYPEFTFIDEADASTYTSIRKLLKKYNLPYKVSKSSKKSFSLESRLSKVNELVNHKKYWICDKCPVHIHEMNVMTVDKTNPKKVEDINNHSFDAICYAITPAFLRGEI